MLIKEERWNRGIVWDKYKAGVINLDSGKVIIPIRFDELDWRIQTFRSPGPGIPPKSAQLIGFACFTNEGEAVAYDADGNIDDWKDWEVGFLHLTPDPRPEKSLEEIEKEFFERYHFDIKREEVEDLLRYRMKILNYDWEHTPENARLISAVNERLNAAVREALRLGEEAEKLVKGLCDDWSVEVEVYPAWEEPDSEGEGAPYSIQNIIAELGRSSGISCVSPCFSWWNSERVENGWDFKTATLDDGNSWDEGGFRLPAYMDCYFVHPFQMLYYDNYLLAYSDLLSIKKFCINVKINKS